MDKGAHFHRCDFQVHSPRDPNWVGPRPTSDEERKAYAEKFIKACREKGLIAVAITDHHDLTFFRYIKAAAENEVDNLGNAIQESDKIAIFPGMELTLGVPCQALLIKCGTGAYANPQSNSCPKGSEFQQRVRLELSFNKSINRTN